MMKSNASLMPHAFAHSWPENKLDSWVLSREAIPGFQSKTKKSHFSEHRHFILRFQTRSLFRGELSVPGMNFGLEMRDFFFFRHFHETISLRVELLARMNYFLRYFHEARELFAERCSSGFGLFREETRTDFFRFFRDDSFMKQIDL